MAKRRKLINEEVYSSQLSIDQAIQQDDTDKMCQALRNANLDGVEDEWIRTTLITLLKWCLTDIHDQLCEAVLVFSASIDFSLIETALSSSSGTWLDETTNVSYKVAQMLDQGQDATSICRILSLLMFAQSNDRSIFFPLQQSYFMHHLFTFVTTSPMRKCTDACTQLLALCYNDKERRDHYRFDICQLLNREASSIAQMMVLDVCGAQLNKFAEEKDRQFVLAGLQVMRNIREEMVLDASERWKMSFYMHVRRSLLFLVTRVEYGKSKNPRHADPEIIALERRNMHWIVDCIYCEARIAEESHDSTRLVLLIRIGVLVRLPRFTDIACIKFSQNRNEVLRHLLPQDLEDPE